MLSTRPLDGEGLLATGELSISFDVFSIISKTDQQKLLETFDYAGDIWLYVTKTCVQANYSTLTSMFASCFRWASSAD